MADSTIVLEEHPVEGGVLLLKQHIKTVPIQRPEQDPVNVSTYTFEVVCDLVVIDPPFEKRTRTVRHVFKNGDVAAAFYAQLLTQHSAVIFEDLS